MPPRSNAQLIACSTWWRCSWGMLANTSVRAWPPAVAPHSWTSLAQRRRRARETGAACTQTAVGPMRVAIQHGAISLRSVSGRSARRTNRGAPLHTSLAATHYRCITRSRLGTRPAIAEPGGDSSTCTQLSPRRTLRHAATHPDERAAARFPPHGEQRITHTAPPHPDPRPVTGWARTAYTGTVCATATSASEGQAAC